MKFYQNLLFVLVVSWLVKVTTYAQNILFPEENSTWATRYYQAPPASPAYSYNSISYNGDTLLNGLDYAKYVTSENNIAGFFTRIEGQKVYLKRNVDELLVYDFGLVEGDTFLYPNQGTGPEYIILDSTKLVPFLDGNERKLYYFTWLDNSNIKVIWAEGIGDLNKGLMPYSSFEGGPTLLCYGNGAGKIYIRENFQEYCDSIMNITNYHHLHKVSSLNFNVFPNPSNGNLIIELDLKNKIDDEYEMIVVDIKGKVVFSEKDIRSKSKNISLNLPKGIYFAFLKGSREIPVRKILVF